MNIRLTLITAILLLSFGEIFAQSKTVMIKSIEPSVSGTGFKKYVYIVDEKGQLETIDLEKHNNKGVAQNMIILKNILDGYLQKGYKIISSTSTGAGETGFLVEYSYLLEKKD